MSATRERPIKQPSAEHPISIEANPARITVTVAGQLVANLPAGGDRSGNAVWQYRDAYPAVAEISGYLAFYPDRVDSIG